jgi:hypothetical protein
MAGFSGDRAGTETRRWLRPASIPTVRSGFPLDNLIRARQCAPVSVIDYSAIAGVNSALR